MSKNPRYAVSSKFIYNIFGADEHIAVKLWRYNNTDGDYDLVQQWTYSTFLAHNLATTRARKKLMKLHDSLNADIDMFEQVV